VINPCSLTAIAFERMGPRLLAFNDTGSLEHLRPKPEQPPAAEQEPGAAPADESPADTPVDAPEAIAASSAVA
jgi:hypothetical protein